MHDRKAAYLLITEREFLINTKKNSNSRFILFVLHLLAALAKSLYLCKLYIIRNMARRSEYRGTDKSRAPRGRKVTVKEENTLLPFLFGLLNEQSKSSVKALLAHGQISVNGTVTSQFNTPLTPGDEVLISYERGKVEFNNPLLTIVWEDDDLIVVNKKEGLLSVSSTRVKERTALHLLSEYVKKTDPRNKIFVLHRLDRDTSGLMMFAKNLQVQKALQSNWNSHHGTHIRGRSGRTP